MRYLTPALGIIILIFLLGMNMQGTGSSGFQGSSSGPSAAPPSPMSGNRLELEGGGGVLLLETGDALLLE